MDVEVTLRNWLDAAFLAGLLGCICTMFYVFWKGTGEEQLDTISLENLPDEKQGLYGKFHVERLDGSSEPGGKHNTCEYFVLDLDHDQYALETLSYYAQACKETHPLLARDLMDRVRAAFEKMDDEGKL